MSLGSIASNSSIYFQSAQATSSTNATTSVATTTPSIDTTTASVSSTTTDTFTTPTKWGFKVDSNGYFGTDFNKAAGLPENMKINQKMMDMADEYSKARGDNVDPLAIVSKVFNLYKTVAGNTFDPNGTGLMSEAEVNKMPQGYVSKGTLLDGVASVQMTESDMMHEEDLAGSLSMVSNGAFALGCRGLRGAADSADEGTDTPFKSDKGYVEYINGTNAGISTDNSKISTGELFSSFFYSSTHTETTLMQTYDGTKNGTPMDQTKAYCKFLDGGQDIKTYITQTNGKDDLGQIAKIVGTMPDGKFDSSLVDTFFDDLEKGVAQSRADYQANNYSSLDSTASKSSDSSSLSKLSKAYQASSGSTAKLPSGSLISVGA